MSAMDAVFDLLFPYEGLVSREVMKILSNPVDRESYMDAIDKMRNGSHRETVKLESGEEIEIYWGY